MDTTAGLTGNVIVELDRRPELRQQLIDDPALIGAATEEFLRHDSPSFGLYRTVTRDAVFHGEQLRRGDRAILMFPAAGLDPATFEDPDTIDFVRTSNRHMAFGLGAHRCLGSHHAWIMFRVDARGGARAGFPTSASPDRSCASKTPATCTPCVSCRSRSRPAPAAPRPEPGARTMDAHDLVLISVDDHVVEPRGCSPSTGRRSTRTAPARRRGRRRRRHLGVRGRARAERRAQRRRRMPARRVQPRPHRVHPDAARAASTSTNGCAT